MAKHAAALRLNLVMGNVESVVALLRQARGNENDTGNVAALVNNPQYHIIHSLFRAELNLDKRKQRKLLLEMRDRGGADIDLLDSSGWTVLHKLVDRDDPKEVVAQVNELIFEFRADPTIPIAGAGTWSSGLIQPLAV